MHYSAATLGWLRLLFDAVPHLAVRFAVGIALAQPTMCHTVVAMLDREGALAAIALLTLDA